MRFPVIYLLLLCLSGSAQPHLDKYFTRKQYSTYEGLVQSQVNRIVQDSKGYLWICTKGGLSRFDGAKFQNFVDGKDGERINIQNIVEINHGFIVSSVTKIFRFTYEEENPENWRFEDLEIPGNYRFYVTSNYFINQDDSCLYIFNVRKDEWPIDQFVHFKYDFVQKNTELLPLGEKPVILTIKDKHTRYCFSPDRLFLLQDSTFQCRQLPLQFDAYALNPVDSSLYAWQKSSKTIFRISRDFRNSTPVFHNIFMYQYGWAEPNIMIINNLGQFIFLNESRQVCLISQSQPKVVASLNFGRCLFNSRENNLWVATEEGIFNLFKVDFEQYNFNISSSIDNVWTLVCAPDSTMWFGGYFNGVWSCDKKGHIKKYNHHDFNIPAKDTTKYRNVYMGGIRDKEGRIYIPSSSGMLIIDNKELRYRDTKSIPMSFLDDPKHNRLILGKISGLEIIEKGTFRTLLDVPCDHYLVSTCINREGNVIAGSFRKQFILEGDSLKPYPSAMNLGVISMTKDPEGNIWKGTMVGLFLDDGKKEIEILPESIKGSISSVFIKYPWLLATTVKNMYLINLSQFYKSGQASALKFGAENGYIAMDGGQNGFCEDNEGKVWYTVTDKVLRFSPDSLARHFNDYLPKPHFASISSSKNTIDWHRISSLDTTDLVLEHDYNSLRINIFANSETKADKVMYQYRVLGMSDEWSQTTKITQQTFTNLNPGNYRIGIRSSVDGEHWSEVVSSPAIYIVSAWYQNWWVYLVEIILFGSFIALMVWYFIRQKQKEAFRKLKEQKRLNELRLQSVRSKNIPHFSGNALANIEHFIFSADLRQANKFLSKYSKLMNITLRDADKASRTIEQEIEYVKLYLELEKMRFGDQLEYLIEVDESIDQRKELPNMLLQTWVENAIKHGIRHKEGLGKINVSVRNSSSESILVRVEDNGVGREKAKALGTTGTGQGLKILAEQITIYNQINSLKIIVSASDLTGEDGSPSGTRFEMIIPNNYRFEF